MKLLSAQDMSIIWGISVQRVREFCRDGRIPNATQTSKGWMIPEGTLKPGTDIIRETPQTKLVKKLLYQRERNQHFGLYEYIQVNLSLLRHSASWQPMQCSISATRSSPKASTQWTLMN